VLARRNWAPEALTAGKGVAYLWCPAGMTGSALVPELERAVGKRVTMRNWATVTRLHAMLCV
jgi:uncharacterized protein (DUF1697 family)